MFSKLVIRAGRYEDEAQGVRVFGRRATVTEISSCRSYQDYWCEPCVVPAKRVGVGEGNEGDGSVFQVPCMAEERHSGMCVMGLARVMGRNSESGVTRGGEVGE